MALHPLPVRATVLTASPAVTRLAAPDAAATNPAVEGTQPLAAEVDYLIKLGLIKEVG